MKLPPYRLLKMGKYSVKMLKMFGARVFDCNLNFHIGAGFAASLHFFIESNSQDK